MFSCLSKLLLGRTLRATRLVLDSEARLALPPRALPHRPLSKDLPVRGGDGLALGRSPANTYERPSS